jgi:predicted RNA-binding Zn-ribbon protein involved in translation (DUF1610 family)
MPRTVKTQKTKGEIPIEYALMESKPFENTTQYSCDMCGQLTLAHKLTRVDEYLYLCPICYSHIETISEQELKESLTRLLLGNIL